MYKELTRDELADLASDAWRAALRDVDFSGQEIVRRLRWLLANRNEATVSEIRYCLDGISAESESYLAGLRREHRYRERAQSLGAKLRQPLPRRF